MIIGNVELKGNVFMAPLAGITDAAFRIITTRAGSNLNFTEMVSAKGLYYDDRATNRLTYIDSEEGPVGMQIFGNDPEIIKKVVEEKINPRQDISIIDINMGCPAPKIVKNNEGSALMKDLSLAEKVIKAVVTTSNKPVTVKFRLGWDDNSINYLELGKIAEESGASMVTLHPRTRKAFYSGKADWNAITKLKKSLAIPVIGNGDINTYQDILDIQKITGCDGVCVARGALSNPFIFMNKEPNLGEIIDLIKEHYQLKQRFIREEVAVKEMRKHVAWYLKGVKNSNKLKNSVNTMTSLPEIYKLLDEFRCEMR